jgi:large subunit ribosomal protein L18
MFTKHDRSAARTKRHRRVRRRVLGSDLRPRLAVHRSANHITAQVIDDSLGRTLAAASTVEPELRTQLNGKRGIPAAEVVGLAVAERAKAAGISAVVFDRGGYLFHGRVKALADAARKAGLEF